MAPAARDYLIVTASYWGFTLVDGALRMVVLLHFYKLGYSPFTLASLFLLYEFAGIVANLTGGWLAVRFGRKKVFIIAAGGFTIASFLCGTATSIEEMVLWRALQGFIGGGMIPTTFAASYAMFPLSQRARIMPLMGLVVPFAPTIGPTEMPRSNATLKRPYARPRSGDGAATVTAPPTAGNTAP